MLQVQTCNATDLHIKLELLTVIDIRVFLLFMMMILIWGGIVFVSKLWDLLWPYMIPLLWLIVMFPLLHFSLAV